MSTLKEIEAYIHKGQKIMAIKLYRNLTGSGLRESKAAVEEFMSRGHWGDQVKGVQLATEVTSSAPNTTSTNSINLGPVISHIEQRKKIWAIKELRSLTGLGLKQAKEAVEAYIDHQRWPPSVARLLVVPELRDAEELAGHGKKLQAIKAVRSVVSVSLKQTKEAVEHFMEHGYWPHPIRALVRDKTASPTPTNQPPPAPAAAACQPSSQTARSPKPTPSTPRLRLDPEAAAVKGVLEAIIEPKTVDAIYSVKRDFTAGYIALVGNRAYFLTQRFGSWEIDGEYAKSDGIEAEVNTSFSRVELRLRHGFLPYSFTELDEATARKIAQVLSD